MGILLVLAGLAIGGGILSAIGRGMEGEQKAQQAELEAQKQRESTAVMRAQIKAMAADRAASAERLALQQKGLAIQGLRTERAGAEAQAAIGAAAGAGNLGGVSPLRQARAVQRKTGWGMAELGGQRREAQLGYEEILRNIDVRTLATEFDIRWAGKGAESLEKQAGFYRTYGWLSGAGDILSAGAGAIGLFK